MPTVVKEPDITRPQLQANIDTAKEAVEAVDDQIREAQQHYRAAVNRGNTDAALEAKRKLASLADERETASDRLEVLERQWPKVEAAEARDRLPAMIEARNAKLKEQAAIAQSAPQKFLAVVETMQRCRVLEKELITDDAEIHRIATEAGVDTPPLAHVARMDGAALFTVTDKISTIASGEVYQKPWSRP